MKKLILISLALSTMSMSVFAQRIIPSCTNPEVILSTNQIPCQKIPLLPGSTFDLPELNLNFKDLGKIFEETNQALLGAESGGGSGRVQPARTAQRSTATPVFNSSFKLECSASLLISAEKTIHYLLKQDFVMTPQVFDKYLTPDSWSQHYVTKEMSHNPKVKYIVPKGLEIDLTTYALTLNPTMGRGLFKSSLCQTTTNGKSGVNTSCSQAQMSMSANDLFMGSISSKKINGKNLKITHSLEILCQRVD